MELLNAPQYSENQSVILKRNETPLPKSGAGIGTDGGQVVAIQVRFEGGKYPDRDLGDGRILHIGMGLPEQGNQKETHGNKAMILAENDRLAFPVYQMLDANAYRFLGRYVVQSHSYGLIDERYPEWHGFKFVIRPVWMPDAVDEAVNGVEDDPEQFAKDIPPGLPPDRLKVVREIIKRNRRLADERKRATNYSCEICRSHSEWFTTKGTPYVEAHHIIPLGDNGFDDERNLIIVCADCHRRLHYAANRHDELRALRVKRGLENGAAG